MTQVDPEVSRKRLETGLRWGGGIAGVIALGFALPYILAGVASAAVALVAGVVGYVAIQLWPVFSFKLANARMKMIVAEAEDNPIETLKNDFIERSEQLAEAEQATANFETEVRTYDDKLEGFKENHPEEAEDFETISEEMNEALASMKGEMDHARGDLKDLEKRVEKAEAIYDMALAAERVTALSGKSRAKVFADIKQKVAFDACRKKLHSSFANLDLALKRREFARAGKKVTPAQLTAGEIPTLPHGAVAREPAPFERESSAFPRDKVKEGRR